jgi:hypothetical protein
MSPPPNRLATPAPKRWCPSLLVTPGGWVGAPLIAGDPGGWVVAGRRGVGIVDSETPRTVGDPRLVGVAVVGFGTVGSEQQGAGARSARKHWVV